MKNRIQSYNSFNESKMSDEITNKQNEILDKISSNGIESLTNMEKKFIDSFATGTEEEVYNTQKTQLSIEKNRYKQGPFIFDVEHVIKDNIGEVSEITGHYFINFQNKMYEYYGIISIEFDIMFKYDFEQIIDQTKYNKYTQVSFEDMLEILDAEVEFYEFISDIVPNII